MPNKHLSVAQKKQHYIKSTIKNSKEILAGFSTPEEAKIYHSNLWFSKYCCVNNDYSVKELLEPARQQMSFKGGISKESPNGILAGHNGLWRIIIHPRSRKSFDFDIAVRAGREYRFHSKVIRHSIISRHGETAYEQWREMAKADIQSLKDLIHETQSRINIIPWSYTCSKSAANLCEAVGISTYRGTAFLFPESFS